MPSFSEMQPCVTPTKRFVLPKNVLKGVIYEYLGYREAHIQNHVRRRKDYKTYWRALNKCGLWKNPIYQARKVELGNHVNAVRERMPNCVIKDVRSRFPNPPGIPHML